MVLKHNDTIGIIALSGNCDKEKVLSAKKFFESLGYDIKLSENIFAQNRYLAGSDEDKVGSWAWNIISIEDEAPKGFGKIKVSFIEE